MLLREFSFYIVVNTNSFLCSSSTSLHQIRVVIKSLLGIWLYTQRAFRDNQKFTRKQSKDKAQIYEPNNLHRDYLVYSSGFQVKNRSRLIEVNCLEKRNYSSSFIQSQVVVCNFIIHVVINLLIILLSHWKFQFGICLQFQLDCFINTPIDRFLNL